MERLEENQVQMLLKNGEEGFGVYDVFMGIWKVIRDFDKSNFY